MPRVWTCRKCGTPNPRTKQRCPTCAGKRPAARTPSHRAVLEQPYDVWVERFGEQCGICGRAPSAARRLDRDHDHRTGQPRGLLCHTCNRTLSNTITVDWLRRAVEYLEASEQWQKEWSA